MDNLIWMPPHSDRPLGAAAARVAEAVAQGRQGGLFPPVANEIDAYVGESRKLSGETDAAVIAAALTTTGFAPIVAALERANHWCERAAGRHADLVAADVLSLDNEELFGPVFTELFTVCAAARLPDRDGYCRRRLADWLSHLDVFLSRLRTERHGELDRYFGMSGPIVELSAHGAETHNAGRRVLRLVSADKTTVAYKARPAHGEALFLTRDSHGDTPASVFALLNRLTDGPDLELPTLRCRSRGEGFDGWLWQEWVQAAPARPIHREHGLTVTGPVVETEDCPRLWSRAGALTSAAMAFGLGDLVEGNLLAGRTADDPAVRHYAVDLEVFGLPAEHLSETGLTCGPGPLHHVGFENRPRLCAVDSPVVYFRETGDGLQLVRTRGPWARNTTDTVVCDTNGRFGYGPYLPHFARGAFDLWSVLCRHRDEISAFARERSGAVRTRVVPRDTAEYCEILHDRLLTGEPLPTRLDDSERRQLETGDVPYFHAAIGDKAPLWPREWDLAGLGMTLRGALDHAEDTTPRQAAGVRTGAREVAVDWPEFDSRLVYSWDDDTNRVKVGDLNEPEPLAEVAERLRRIDDADAVLRTAWVEGGRSDAELTARLEELGTEAITWLEAVVDEHGWPTADLVGEAAAAGAVRLLQHVDGAVAFRRRCLRELEAAALDGRAALPDVAFVTDSLCLADGLPQRYGTKFERVDGELVPCRLAEPDGIDAARAAMGLSGLDEYAQRIRDSFDPPKPTADTDPGAAP